MDFLIFVGEVIWALAGSLDLLQKNPLTDFLMGGFLNARNPLYKFTTSSLPEEAILHVLCSRIAGDMLKFRGNEVWQKYATRCKECILVQ